MKAAIAMRDALLERIWERMESEENIFFVTADFGSPVLDKIRADYPSRYLNVGIAEQNLINISAGLGLEGYVVFAYAIAPFITMRCYEQIRVNLALLAELRSLNVNLIGVGAGYSYVVSGPTHQCYEDITLMRCLPNFQVLSPADHITASELLVKCVKVPGPKYLRLDAQILPIVYSCAPPDIRKGFHLHRKGNKVCIIATGYMLHTALEAAELCKSEAVEVGVIDLFDLSTFDADAFQEVIKSYRSIVSLEEGFRGKGGLDSLLFDFVAKRSIAAQIINLGVEGQYSFELGTRAELQESAGIGLHAVMQAIRKCSDTND